tara:strand:+ start:1190 stop:1423 length:234 start_codon:yes stop_codon:yes gene_type:complete
MSLQLSLHGSFGELLDQRGQDAAFTGEVFALTQSFEHHRKAASISNMGLVMSHIFWAQFKEMTQNAEHYRGQICWPY